MGYASTRRLVLAAGVAFLLLVAAVLFVRSVDTIEVVAVILFIPVFLAFTFGGLVGGAIGGLLATAVYAVLRNPAIDAVGGGRFAGILVGRGLGYLAFGVLGGWATQQLERSLEKLDVYDQVDDDTGLFNARFLVQDTDLEMSRAGRYRTFFSVCMVELPVGPVEALPRRKRAALLRELGEQLRDAVRSVDRAVHARDGSVHRFAVVCPETSAEGARIFADRLAERVAAFARSRGVALADGSLVATACTFPGDEERLAAIREQFAAIDRSEHPEHPTEVAAPHH